MKKCPILTKNPSFSRYRKFHFSNETFCKWAYLGLSGLKIVQNAQRLFQMLLEINSVAKGGLRVRVRNRTKHVPTLSDAPGKKSCS